MSQIVHHFSATAVALFADSVVQQTALAEVLVAPGSGFPSGSGVAGELILRSCP